MPAKKVSRIAAQIQILKLQVKDLISELDSLSQELRLDPGSGICLREEVRRFEIDLIRLALKQVGGNQARAAKVLDLKPSTLNAKIKAYDIPVER